MGDFSYGPKWRNGRRDGLKNRWGQPRVGSTPTFGTTTVALASTMLFIEAVVTSYAVAGLGPREDQRAPSIATGCHVWLGHGSSQAVRDSLTALDSLGGRLPAGKTAYCGQYPELLSGRLATLFRCLGPVAEGTFRPPARRTCGRVQWPAPHSVGTPPETVYQMR